MAKLSKTIRKGAGSAVRSQFVQGILRDVIKTALIAAAAKFGQSSAAGRVKEKAKRVVGVEPGKRKSRKKRKAR